MTSALSLLLAAFAPSGQGDRSLDAFLQGEMKHSPGMSVAVVRNGKVEYAKGFGYADLQNDVKAAPGTVYRIGSVTKQFTATVIMQLVQEGKLRLDEPMRKLLPDLPEAWDKVTVRHLLSHTGGVPNYTSIPEVMERSVLVPTTPKGILATVDHKPLDFEPGSKWSYSNTGYEILGMIVEKLDGRPLAESLRERIFRPLGMTQTYFTSNADLVKHRAQGYTERDGKTYNAGYIDMTWPYAAGSMESTVLDLAKWDAALYGDKVLPQAALRQMWTRTRLATGKDADYGFGWGLSNVRGTEIIEHNGGIPGFVTIIRRAPSKGLTVIVMTNSDHGDAIPIAEKLMARLDPSLKRAAPAKIEDKDPVTTAFARKTFESILAGTVDRSKFGPELAKILTPEFLEGARKDLNSQGPLKAFDLVASRDEGGRKIRRYAVTLGDTVLQIEMTIGQSGLIEGMNVHG